MVDGITIMEPKGICPDDFVETARLPRISHKDTVASIGVHFYRTEHSGETLYKYFISFTSDNGSVIALRHIPKINLPPHAYSFKKDLIGFGWVDSFEGKNIYVFSFETIAEEEKLMARARETIEADIVRERMSQTKPAFKISAGDGTW